jgi:hypothetical protein
MAAAAAALALDCTMQAGPGQKALAPTEAVARARGPV